MIVVPKANMTTTVEQRKRWRPRFSLRTLTIFVALVCLYFGAWEGTKRWGVPAIAARVRWKNLGLECPAPFYVVAQYSDEEMRGMPTITDGTSNTSIISEFVIAPNRVVIIWFFGQTWETPIRWEVEEPETFSSRWTQLPKQ